LKYRPTVDVVIPCYNVAHIVEKCVTSILNQQYPHPVKVFLVDDGSSDHTLNQLQVFSRHPAVTVLRHKNNRGLAATRNTGIKAGSGEVICFLDSDMVVQPNWIESLVNVLSDHQVVGVIGDSTCPEDEPMNSLDQYLYHRKRGARQFGDNSEISFPYFLFHNTAVKRSVFEIIDLFNEKITSYGGEDTDLAIRLWEAYPKSLRYSSKAQSIHYHKREFNEFCQLMYRYGKINLPSLIAQFPQYSDALGGEWIHSIKGYFLFNPIIRWGIRNLDRFCDGFWLARYQVIDAVIRGARSSIVEK